MNITPYLIEGELLVLITRESFKIGKRNGETSPTYIPLQDLVPYLKLPTMEETYRREVREALQQQLSNLLQVPVRLYNARGPEWKPATQAVSRPQPEAVRG